MLAQCLWQVTSPPLVFAPGSIKGFYFFYLFFYFLLIPTWPGGIKQVISWRSVWHLLRTNQTERLLSLTHSKKGYNGKGGWDMIEVSYSLSDSVIDPHLTVCLLWARTPARHPSVWHTHIQGISSPPPTCMKESAAYMRVHSLFVEEGVPLWRQMAGYMTKAGL